MTRRLVNVLLGLAFAWISAGAGRLDCHAVPAAAAGAHHHSEPSAPPTTTCPHCISCIVVIPALGPAGHQTFEFVAPVSSRQSDRPAPTPHAVSILDRIPYPNGPPKAPVSA